MHACCLESQLYYNTTASYFIYTAFDPTMARQISSLNLANALFSRPAPLPALLFSAALALATNRCSTGADEKLDHFAARLQVLPCACACAVMCVFRTAYESAITGCARSPSHVRRGCARASERSSNNGETMVSTPSVGSENDSGFGGGTLPETARITSNRPVANGISSRDICRIVSTICCDCDGVWEGDHFSPVPVGSPLHSLGEEG